MKEAIQSAIARLREYPGRARELMVELRAQNDKGKKIEPWKEDQLNKFVKVLIANVAELERAFSENNVSKTAWVARNVLELSIWVQYCNLSDEHGKRFRVDGARDAVGFMNAFKEIHVAALGSEVATIDAAEADLERTVKNEFGVQSLGSAYEEVRKAAEEVGEKRFKYLNKLCSKFAHPTAWVVGSVDWPEFDGFAMMFLIEGTMLANEALENIRKFVLKRYPSKVQTAVP